MTIKKRTGNWSWLVATLAVLGLYAAPINSKAQVPGNNAVWSGSSASVTASTAFIDASVFAHNTNGHASLNDLCSVLSYIYSSANTFNPIPATGAVIDARGIPVGASSQCANTNPWPATAPPTTVLLPAGVITIFSTWQVPSGTHLIGQRRNTIISPCVYNGTSCLFVTGSYLMDMGPTSCSCPAAGCPPVVVEDVTFQGSQSAPYANYNGIDNECSGALSYVDHIVFDLAGIGLHIAAGAAGSGPYSNINYIGSTYCNVNNLGSSCPSHCVEIMAPTRGVHGITCTLNTHAASPAITNGGILLDASNNSIEDIHIEGFYDGVLIGDSAAAGALSLLHLTSGDGGLNSGPVMNTVHISTSFPVTDVAISQVVNNTSGGDLIKDDVTNTIVGTGTSGHEYSAGLYALGEVVPGTVAAGYSRFSTTTTKSSTTAATPVWGVAALTSGTPPTPCSVGAIFSNTNGAIGSSNTIYVCQSSTTWSPLSN
jgi:hypothetical protein